MARKFKKNTKYTKAVSTVQNQKKEKPVKKASSKNTKEFKITTAPSPLVVSKKRFNKISRSQIYSILIVVLVALIMVAIGSIVYLQQQISQNQGFGKDINVNSSVLIPELTDSNFQISAHSAIVFDTNDRVVVYQKDANFRFSPASTTKIMTATIALENYNLDSIITVPQSVDTIVGSEMGLVPGEQISIRSLMYGMMLPSGNDAAYVLSTLDPGGAKGFVAKMNAKARELKLSNTHFVDSSGYNDANYTSAFDLARLAAYAFQNPTFRQIVQTKAITVTDQSGLHVYQLENLNKLLSDSDVFGIKTGFTNEAGEVLVTSFLNNGKTYIIVVMKSDDRFGDTQTILDKIQTEVKLLRYNR